VSLCDSVSDRVGRVGRLGFSDNRLGEEAFMEVKLLLRERTKLRSPVVVVVRYFLITARARSTPAALTTPQIPAAACFGPTGCALVRPGRNPLLQPAIVRVLQSNGAWAQALGHLVARLVGHMQPQGPKKGRAAKTAEGKDRVRSKGTAVYMHTQSGPLKNAPLHMHEAMPR